MLLLRSRFMCHGDIEAIATAVKTGCHSLMAAPDGTYLVDLPAELLRALLHCVGGGAFPLLPAPGTAVSPQAIAACLEANPTVAAIRREQHWPRRQAKAAPLFEVYRRHLRNLMALANTCRRLRDEAMTTSAWAGVYHVLFALRACVDRPWEAAPRVPAEDQPHWTAAAYRAAALLCAWPGNARFASVIEYLPLAWPARTSAAAAAAAAPPVGVPPGAPLPRPAAAARQLDLVKPDAKFGPTANTSVTGRAVHAASIGLTWADPAEVGFLHGLATAANKVLARGTSERHAPAPLAIRPANGGSSARRVLVTTVAGVFVHTYIQQCIAAEWLPEDVEADLRARIARVDALEKTHTLFLEEMARPSAARRRAETDALHVRKRARLLQQYETGMVHFDLGV
jgi:hypothetical protein